MLPRHCLQRCGSTPSLGLGAFLTLSPAIYTRHLHQQHSDKQDDEHAKVVFSGIQPTGVPHLGNYLGALQRWVTLQNEAERNTTSIYSLVDLHAITVRQDPAQLRQWKRESLAMLLAIGLDPKRSIIFHQSDVPAHAELMWILSCQASTGYLGRMTQWKDKTAGPERENREKLKLGLFSYPVLQAADVLVHGTTHVPVGHDQAQHLEFAREVANGFNSTYGAEILVPPETLLSPAKRVMSLTDPTAKMSKSHANPKSRILLNDTEDLIRAKIKAAVTDANYTFNYDPVARPGVSNLAEILYHCGNTTRADMSFEDFAKAMEDETMPAFKSRVADGINAAVKPIRERYSELINDQSSLDREALEGAKSAQKNASIILAKVRMAVGIA